jgi:hypothetical protein
VTLDLIEVMLEEILRGTPPQLQRDWRMSPDHRALVRDANRSAAKLRRMANPETRAGHVEGMRVVRSSKAARGLCKDCPAVVATNADGSRSSRCSTCLDKHRAAWHARPKPAPSVAP